MRWRRLLILLAVCAVVIAVLIALIPHEPKYEGRALSEWIKDSAPRRSPDPEQTRAIEAVRHIGTNGLPWLVKWIGAKEPPDWQIKLITANSRLPRWVRLRLLPSLFGINSYYGRRRQALDGFLILGPQAAPAVPDLLQIMASSPNGSPASAALDDVGIAGLPTALNIMTNRSNAIELRVAAGVWISHTDPKTENEMVVSLMTQCVRDKNPKLTPIAARMLANRRAEPELVVPVLAKQLRDPNPEMRGNAVSGLRQYGPGVASVVPELVSAIHDPHPVVRALAVDALFEIDPHALEKAAPAAAERKREWRRIVDSLPQRSGK
jgi:hypothetical protein